MQQQIGVILDELEAGLRERMNTRTWLDDATRERAIEKLEAIHELLAIPTQILNDTYLNNYYSTVR